MRPSALTVAAVSVAAAHALVFLGAAPAAAQSLGTHLSGPTDPDGAASFWNPAAMTRGEGSRLDLGLAATQIRISYDAPSSPGRSRAAAFKPGPLLGGSTDVLGPDWRIGFSLGAPFVSGARWPRGGPEAEITRYYAADSHVFHVLFTPSIAYRPSDRFAFGLGLNVAYSRLDARFDKDLAVPINRSLGSTSPDAPFPTGSPELAAPVHLETAGFGAGALLGVLVSPTERVTLGASLHSPIRARTRGTVNVEYPDAMVEFVRSVAPDAELPAPAGEVDMDLRIPLALYTAAAVRPAERWEVRLDYRFLDLSSTGNTDVLISEATTSDVADTVLVRGRTDRHSAGLRATRDFAAGRARAALRARYETNYIAERTYTPSNMNFQKIELGAGLRWRLGEHVALIGHYSHFILPDVRVDESLHRPVADPELDPYNHPRPLGTYRGGADQLFLAVSVRD